jgi:RNA polymerase sigma-70 factor (ECF subfamily)
MNDLFHQISNEIPKLRRYALALTRDQSNTDDLVQDALTRALSKAHLWQEGTDLRAWLFSILHNQYVDRVRRGVREGAIVALNDSEFRLQVGPSQHARLRLRDLDRALAQLPEEQRQVILLAGMENMSYVQMAEIAAAPIGTIRSRLSRGRTALRMLMGEERQTEEGRQAGGGARAASSRAQQRRPGTAQLAA